VKIGLQTWGSRGDVFPFMALAAGLGAAGHEVTLAVTSDRDHSALAAELGIRLVTVGGDFVVPPAGKLREIVRTGNRLREIELLNEYFFDPATESLYAASKALAAENDVLIGHFWLHTLATAATLAGRPRVAVHFCPLGVRSAYVPAGGPNLGPWLNGLVWDLGDYAMRRRLFRRADALRAAEGLPPLASLQRELLISDTLTLIATSPALCSRPRDWGGHIRVSGYLATPHPGTTSGLDATLRAFLDAGTPPVYLTFGSCDLFYAEDNARLFLDAVALTGERAIVQTDFPDAYADCDPERVFVVSAADHTAVFPRCKLIVHHGGAGTTQTSITAGRPSIAVAHGFDQGYWGRALVAAGVSPRVLARRSVTPARLARAIDEAIAATELAANAGRLGERLAAEDGVAHAVELIEDRCA